MPDVTLQSNIDRFNATFQRYVDAWTARGNGTLDDALEKKGRDLGIKLFQGFRDRKWGGPGRHPGLARAELDVRAAEGRGIRVRSTLMREYLKARTLLRNFVGPQKRGGVARMIRAKVRLWQSFVGRELGLRQSGIGVLAVSFLWYRSRKPQSGVYYVKNRTRRPIGAVEKGDGFLRIIGDALGLSEVDARYGIVAKAISDSEADMLQYFRNIQIKAQFEAAMAQA